MKLTRQWLLMPRTSSELMRRTINYKEELHEMQRQGLTIKTGMGGLPVRRYFWVEPVRECRAQEMSIGMNDIHDFRELK